MAKSREVLSYRNHGGETRGGIGQTPVDQLNFDRELRNLAVGDDEARPKVKDARDPDPKSIRV